MSTEPFDELYFNWLHAKVASSEIPSPSLRYYNLFRILHSIEFVWIILGDDSRAEEGADLRKEFLISSGRTQEEVWDQEGCSVLEMLIALSRRVEFQTETPAREWFWIFLSNLGISDYSDNINFSETEVRDIIEVFVWRLYFENGDGGLFPLQYPKEDQRDLEIWYQLASYLDEKNYL